MDIEKAYQETLDYLYSYVDYSLTRSFRFTPDKFNLDRIYDLLDRLGNPQNSYPIIHVAGTKGKGSVSALLASALQAAGYCTGFYTSPHLQEYTERIQVNRVEITKQQLVDLVEEMKPHIQQVPLLTTFEITTALGFLHFARLGVNAAVVEVGLGGRLDATNVITPAVSVITSLSYDHMSVLGNTLAEIAAEKAGIIKTGRPVVIAPQREEALLVIEKIAAEHASTLTQVGQDYLYAARQHSLDGQTMMVWSAADQERVNQYIEAVEPPTWEPLQVTLSLLGAHQLENAATAYAALQVARQNGLPVRDEDIVQGFANVVWPGRFEVLQKNPPVIVDSAHNRDSALKLRLAIEDYLPGRPVILLFGASEDKDIRGMFTELLPRVRRVIITQSVHPRAAEGAMLVEMAHRFGCPAQTILPAEAAFAHAIQLAGQDAAIVVAGSLFIAAAARAAWSDKKSPPQAHSSPSGGVNIQHSGVKA